MRYNIKATLRKMLTLNFSSNYTRKVLDSVLTSLRIPHPDIFILTDVECKKYIHAIIKWVDSHHCYNAIDNCWNELNIQIPVLCFNS